MREIKFRAWDGEVISDVSEMSWLVKGLVVSGTGNLIGGNIEALVDGKKIVLMQFTGLLDKNGKEIFEGDVLRCGDVNEEHEDFNTEVWFDDGKFLTRHYGFPVSSWAKSTTKDNSWCEVLGNIYENKELLKREGEA